VKKLAALLLILIFLVGCATVAVQPKGTVLEKFVRGGYVERYSHLLIDEEWVQVPMIHGPTFWVIVQGNNCRIEVPVVKESWDSIEVGDVIPLEDGGGGGPA